MRVTREVRRFLRGRITVEEGIVIVLESARDAALGWQGAMNGSVNSVTLGVSRRERTYNVENSEEGFEQFLMCFSRIGRLAAFVEVPDAAGCFKRNGVGNVVLYALEKDLYGANSLTVTVFTGRGLLAPFRLNHAFRVLQNQLNTELGITEMTPEEKRALQEEEKAERMARIQEEKFQRQQEREAARRAKAEDPSLSKNRKIER